MRTREQDRMRQSLHLVRAQKDTSTVAEYGRACLKFPVLVRTAGLCQTVAFYRSRKGAHLTYVSDLATQLESAGLIKNRDLLAALTTEDVATYMLLTREALAIGNWMRRFAQSELGAEDTGE